LATSYYYLAELKRPFYTLRVPTYYFKVPRLFDNVITLRVSKRSPLFRFQLQFSTIDPIDGFLSVSPTQNPQLWRPHHHIYRTFLLVAWWLYCMVYSLRCTGRWKGTYPTPNTHEHFKQLECVFMNLVQHIHRFNTVKLQH